MLPILRQLPEAAFLSGSLEKGVATHRWGKYVVPEGSNVFQMERDADGRLVGEVPGDGNVFDHQMAQKRLVGEYGIFDVSNECLVSGGYVKLRPLSMRDLFALRVTALVHDLWEMEFGDTVYDDKHMAVHTAEDEIAATRRFVRKHLDEGDPRRRRRLERSVMSAYAIDHDASHRLHGIFKLYEKYSYLRGAIHIYAEGKGSIARSEYAVHNVLKNQTAPLLAAAKAGVPSTQAFLEWNAEVISAMFDYVSNSGFTDSDVRNQEGFEHARVLWKEYAENLGFRHVP